MGWSDGIPACAVSTLSADNMLPMPDVLPGFMPEQAAPALSVRRTSPSGPKSATSFWPRLFATVSYRSHHHYSVAKLACRRERPCGLDQWRTASIFLYRAFGLGLRSKIKSIYALSLVHPFDCTYFFRTVKMIH